MRRLLAAVLVMSAALLHAQTKPAVSNMQVNRNMQAARAVQVDPVVVLQHQAGAIAGAGEGTEATT